MNTSHRPGMLCIFIPVDWRMESTAPPSSDTVTVHNSVMSCSILLTQVCVNFCVSFSLSIYIAVFLLFMHWVGCVAAQLVFSTSFTGSPLWFSKLEDEPSHGLEYWSR